MHQDDWDTLQRLLSKNLCKWSWIDTELNKKQDDCDDTQL